MRTRILLGFVAMAAGLGLGPAALAQAPLTPASLSPCAWSPAEVEAVLGPKVSRREAADMKTPAGRDVGCVYTFDGSSIEVSIRQTWDPANSGSAPAAAKGAEGDRKAIPGDPDGAAWKAGPSGERRLELTYSRGKVRTTVVVRGGTFLDEDMQPRLLRLRRVP